MPQQSAVDLLPQNAVRRIKFRHSVPVWCRKTTKLLETHEVAMTK